MGLKITQKNIVERTHTHTHKMKTTMFEFLAFKMLLFEIDKLWIIFLLQLKFFKIGGRQNDGFLKQNLKNIGAFK